MDINKMLAEEFGLRREQIDNTVALIDDDKTIPFIARYRKEVTGSLDDQTLRLIFERLNYLRNLEKRKEEVTAAITEQGKMTPELAEAIDKATVLVEVEDIYRPFKQKRRTRASVAKEKGLEPLAELILAQEKAADPRAAAEGYVDEEKGVAGADEAIQGALDIIAEQVSDDADLRKELRAYFERSAVLSSKGAKDAESSVYDNYYDFSEGVAKIAGHRVLAIDRGEREEKLKVSVTVPEGAGEAFCIRKYLKGKSPCAELISEACSDGYKRLIYPSIEREIRSMLSERAQEGAIKVFKENLRQLLMQPPVKGTITLGLDPGYAHGCKLAVTDETGKVLDTGIVYINTPAQAAKAKQGLIRMIEKNGVNTVSIGNGTASRESEQLVAEIVRELKRKVSYMVVSEAGASVYSASKLAAEEFPDYDVSLRSAVSIARRLQDPLAELVKIDPKAIGVGQYQHDMPPKRMDEALSGVVEDCVNSVGVDLNTASYSLLSYIAGINSGVAKNIVAYREQNGAFTDRRQLLKVPKLGAKAFEQCAGFLRVRGGKDPLDNTAVHPESYKAAKELLEKCGYSLADVGGLSDLSDRCAGLGMKKLAEELGTGVPTLKDIIAELQKPGRDPRDELPPPLMRSGDVMELKDLKEGMELMGTVRNVIDFGAFVDIGVHEDGLVHISQLSDKFVKHPLDVVKVGQVVKVRVLSVDLKKNRISLTMKSK
ncbi:MAG: RNA-binding transcriptional accessory protein [Ruminococcus sp.]|nr:RNA-binding transcriptional accessory protein [Ruminococcus sp.]